MHVSATRLAGILLVGGTTLSTVQVSAPVRTRSAAIATFKADGKALTIKLRDGRAIKLQSMRREALSGVSRAQCAVTVAGRQVATLGIGETDTYTCNGLIAAGVVPPAGNVQRIGLIYDAGSPNAQFRTALVLRDDKGWHVDPAFAGRFDDTPAGRTMAGLRRALR